jgi:hypothetical protein
MLPLVFDCNYSRVDVHLYTQPSPFQSELIGWYDALGGHTVATFGATTLGDVWNSWEVPTLSESFFAGWQYEGVMLSRPVRVTHARTHARTGEGVGRALGSALGRALGGRWSPRERR